MSVINFEFFIWSRAGLELSKLLESSGYFLSCECNNMFETGPIDSNGVSYIILFIFK